MTLEELVYIDDTGFHVADYSEFLAWQQANMQAIYGADIYLEADSQDGQYVALQAKALYDTAMVGASVYNSFSPSSAQGTGLSRVVKINGLERGIPTNSTADLTIVGQSGTVITNGVAIDTLNQKWDIPSPTTIPGGGSIIVTAVAQELGDITADAATITGIFTPTRGWQTVNNVAAATAGAPVESDATLRARQAVSTANPSLTVFDGTVGAVLNVVGVTKAKGYENDTGSTDGDGIPAHSICLVVVGGDAVDICEAIQIHKTPGTGTYGDTHETVYDSHGMPLIIYFERPDTVAIKVRITLTASQGWSTDYEADIQDAIIALIDSNAIGDNVQISKLYAPAYLNGSAAGETYDISALEIAKTADAFGVINIPIDFDEYATVQASDITFVVS